VSEPGPEGLVYRPDFLTYDEEGILLELLDGQEFEPIVMRGVTARRTGLRYRGELPEWLEPWRTRGAALAGLQPDELVQALVQRYPAAAPIGWHRDYLTFDVVVGISLGADARMRFRRDTEQAEILLERRSAYVLAGEARWKWEHHVPPVKELRYSITFRSLR
jgi:alkylated DNA repair protein (DNA oxidative demethylase)